MIRSDTCSFRNIQTLLWILRVLLPGQKLRLTVIHLNITYVLILTLPQRIDLNRTPSY